MYKYSHVWIYWHISNVNLGWLSEKFMHVFERFDNLFGVIEMVILKYSS